MECRGGVWWSWFPLERSKLEYCAVIGSRRSYLLTIKGAKARCWSESRRSRKNKSNVRQITRLGNRISKIGKLSAAIILFSWGRYEHWELVIRGMLKIWEKIRFKMSKLAKRLEKVKSWLNLSSLLRIFFFSQINIINLCGIIRRSVYFREIFREKTG